MTGIEISPVTASIGAEVTGVDLRKPLDPSDRSAIHGALSEHLAVFFRDQPLAPEELLAFGRQFGELEIHAFAPTHPDYEEVVVIDQVHPLGEGTACWHADATFSRVPPGYGVLLPAQLPAVGGDTCFASAVAAFEALSSPLRELLLGLSAVHDLTQQLSLSIARGRVDHDLSERQAQFPPVTHPVVITDPAGGRRALYVNGNYTTRLEGVTPAESRRLLRFLFEHMGSPEFQCRFHWEPGSIAMWDNLLVQHYAVPDYGDRRVMHRLNIAGRAPA